MRSAVVVVLCSLAGCTFSTHGVADDVVADDAPVPDASTIDATPDLDAGCAAHCDGATLVTCDGTTEVETACPLGCGETGAPHCLDMVPSNLAGTGDLDDVTGSLMIPAAKVTVMTDTGSITLGDGTIVRAAGAMVGGTRYRQINDELAVLAVDELLVEPGVALYAFGNRALIILASGPVQLGGHLDFSAGCDLGGAGFTARCGGPGGGDGGSSLAVNGGGCAGGTGGTSGGNDTGGAGGGNASMGGDGGAAAGKVTPVATAITSCAGPTLIPLAGGGGGGAGAPSGTSVGGGGGGALQISSLTSITIGASASADVPTFYLSGAGGTGTTSTNKAGGGGGAGGALLLEAPVVTAFDLVVITGGGGGGGGRTSAQDGVWSPEDGLPAAGGAGDPAGNGGTGATPTSAAAAGGGGVAGTGGGGGGFGRLRINTLTGVFTMPAGAIIDASSSSGTIGLD